MLKQAIKEQKPKKCKRQKSALCYISKVGTQSSLRFQQAKKARHAMLDHCV